MKDVTVRLHFRDAMGNIADAQQDFNLESFAGFLPNVGDRILDPGVLQGLERSDPKNREVWTVVGRFFGARDLPNYVALIVEARAPDASEHIFVTLG